MARNDTEAQIRARVEAFVDEMTALVRTSALESLQEALGGGAPARRTAPKTAGGPRTARKAAPRRRKGGRRTPEEIHALGMSVYDYVKQNAGQRLEEIGKGLEIATAELKRPISNLIEVKALRTTGQKRGTKYFTGSGDPAKAAATVGAPRKAAATRKKPVRKKKKTTRK